MHVGCCVSCAALSSREEGPPCQLASHVCMCIYVYMNMHVYLCICCGYLRRWCCQQVNPALRLGIKLLDQTINNSDCSLSRSITEHRLRGRQRHDKGTEVIYRLIQLIHIQMRVDADSMRNYAWIHWPKSQQRIHACKA